ncbi:hypothetical protein E0Z06_13870 [Rheinheimera sp. D18]|uniref:hypothetical protein n=1 Tax=Rheinheimera sp. D18 TaxID=2545632 RepID=UPI0010454F32|nr:hypothetical protein [Rheinheimera sp. D18]QBL10536.1 hypothetical protein E0Z06_13870 [Rheinheimera sp. D18]
MKNTKILTYILLINMIFLTISCTNTDSTLNKGSSVLIANDSIIRFSFSLNQEHETIINKYAIEHCKHINKKAVRGNQQCDGSACEIAYFCE